MVDARHLDKSPDAFRTISEVADDLELPQHVLRFWETRFTHIRPVKRAGGRRYYRPDDVELLRGIRHLLYSEGYTIKGVQKILKDQGVRHVQALGYDDGEPAPAEMRSAPPPRAPASKAASQPPQSEEGGGLGGLLGGLLPRRRARSEREEPRIQAGHDEPPLPFPDFANFTPRSEDLPEEPRRASAPREATAQRRAPSRTEPAFDADETDDDMPFGAPDRRHEPPFAAAPRRPAPVQRPSRGPASRLPDPPALPELDDPLLPFFDDHVSPDEPISEPLDARIRRMKENTPQPAGPPEEYIPARARKRSPQAPTRAAVPPSRDLQDFDSDDERDDDLDGRTRGIGGEEMWERPGLEDPRQPRTQARDDVPHSRSPLRDLPPEAPYQESRGMGDQARDRYFDAPASGRMQERAPVPPLTAARTPGRDPFFDAPPPASAPPVASPGRLGPLIGPLEEYDPDEELYDRGVPRSERRNWAQDAARRRDGRGPGETPLYSGAPGAGPQDPGWDRRGHTTRGLDDWTRDEPERPAQDGRGRTRDWPAADMRGSGEPRRGAPIGGEGWRDEPEDYLPPEPHRPGPPEQYLPPHLRSEPRLTGAPVPPAPILSRDDIARLQATLFELTECRRLMAAMLSNETDADLLS